MDKTPTLVKSVCLTTKNKSGERELACGRIDNKATYDNFLFYILESLPESKVMRRIIQSLVSEMNSMEEELNADNFENILKKANEELSKLAQNGDTEWVGNINGIIGVVTSNEISISQTGVISGYIFRKDKISAMTANANDLTPAHPLKTFAEITSGRIIKEDQIIFGNEGFFNKVSLDRLRRLSKLETLVKQVDDLLNYFKKIRSKNINAVILKATEEDSEEEILETIYLDETDQSTKEIFNKYIIPASKKIGLLLKTGGIKLGKGIKNFVARSKDHWEKKSGPKTKQFLSSTKEKIAPQLESLKNSKELNKIKVKAVSYRDRATSKNQFLKVAISSLSQLKVLFYKENRKYLYTILIILALGIGYLKIRANNEKRTDEIEKIKVVNYFDQARVEFNKAKEDLLLGKSSDLSPVLTALLTAQQSLEAESNKEKGTALVREINSFLDEKTKTVRFYDIQGGEFTANIIKMTLIGREIYGITNEGKIYLYDTLDRQVKLVGSVGKEVGEARGLNYSKSLEKLLINTESKVLAFDLNTKVYEELKITEEPSTWETGLGILTYSTNIYLLDAVNSSVWKHTQREGGYSKGSSYLSNKSVSIKDAVDFAIDGNIYVFTSNGKVTKFVKGSPQLDFSIKGIPAPLDKITIPGNIFTDEDTNHLYLLDKGQNRVISFDKASDFANQYVLDGLKIDNFAVNAKLQKMWLLSGEKVYEINL